MYVFSFLLAAAYLMDTPWYTVPTGGLFGNKALEKSTTPGTFLSTFSRTYLIFLFYKHQQHLLHLASLVPLKILPQRRKMELQVRCLLSIVNTCWQSVTAPASTGLFGAGLLGAPKDTSADKKDAPAGKRLLYTVTWLYSQNYQRTRRLGCSVHQKTQRRRIPQAWGLVNPRHQRKGIKRMHQVCSILGMNFNQCSYIIPLFSEPSLCLINDRRLYSSQRLCATTFNAKRQNNRRDCQ